MCKNSEMQVPPFEKIRIFMAAKFSEVVFLGKVSDIVRSAPGAVVAMIEALDHKVKISSYFHLFSNTCLIFRGSKIQKIYLKAGKFSEVSFLGKG
jgi:hypothetical protein